MPVFGRLLERLTVAVDGDTSDVEQKLHGLSDESKGGSWAGKLGGLAAKTGAALVAGVSAGAGIIGGIGLQAAAQGEQASIAFTSILGDAGKAKAFLGDLSNFAAQTPFDLPGLRDAASRLLAVGTNTASVIPLMRTLGDATSAMGTGSEGIDRAVTALTQMQTKGKVTGEEMLQLAEAGVPAWDALATVLGVDVAKAQDMVTKGQVKVASLFQAIETSAGPALGRVKGMMDAQSQSLTGLWSTLKDTLGQGLAVAMGPAVTAIKTVLPDISNTVSQTLGAIGPQIGQLVAGGVGVLRDLLPVVAPLVGTLASVVGKVFSALGPVLEKAAPLIAIVAQNLGGALLQAVQALEPVMPAVGEALGMIAVNLGGAVASTISTAAPLFAELLAAVLPLLAPLTDLAQNVLVVLLPAVVPLVGPLTRLIESLVGTREQAGPLVEVLRTLTDALYKIPTPVLTALVAGFIGMKAADGAAGGIFKVVDAVKGMDGPIGMVAKGLPGLSKGVGAVVPVLVSFGATAWAALAPLLPFIAAAAALAGVAYLIYRNWGTIKDFFAELWDGIKDVVGGAVDWVVDFVVAWPGRVWDAISALPGLVGHAFTEAVRLALAAWAQLFLVLPVKVLEAIPGLVGALIDFGGQLLGWLVGLAPRVVGAWFDMQQWLLRTAWDGLVALVGFFGGLPGRILGALPGVASTLLGVGRDLISGLWNGAQAVWNGFWGFLVSLPGRIIGALGDTGRLLWNVGGDIVRGLWNGLEALTGWIKDKVGGWIIDVLPKQVKSLLHIGSPSRVMAEIGEFAGLGLAQGLDATVGRVAGAAGRLGGAAQPALGDLTVGLRGADGASTGGAAGAAGTVMVTLPDGSIITWREMVTRFRVLLVDDGARSARTALLG